MRLPGTPIACASWFWLMPISARNSSFRISPGCGLRSWVMDSLLHQLHPQVPADGVGGARERAEGDGLVLGIEHAVELGAAGLHEPRQLGLAQALVPHQRVDLPRDHALDGARGHFFVDAFLLQEVIERRSDATLFLLHVTSFFLFVARSKSPCGVFCVFLMNP